MKFKYIHKFQAGGQSKQVDASFGLPEVDIYPQNEFGDIARSQGINRARNWRKVKEGTTKGINDFYNDPRTQMVMAGLPLPSMLDAAGDGIRMAGPIIKNSRAGKTAKEIFGNIKGNVKKYYPQKMIVVQFILMKKMLMKFQHILIKMKGIRKSLNLLQI